MFRIRTPTGYEQDYDDHVLLRERNSPNSLRFQQYEAPTNLGKSNTEIRLKDVADIALTTLAFLSFGMFILQVLMCITMVCFDGYIFTLYIFAPSFLHIYLDPTNM